MNPATDGTLNLTDSAVSWNKPLGTQTQSRGDGGIVNGSDGKAVLKNSTINGNEAGRGGGIKNTGRMRLINCTISGNIADKGNGGAIYSESTLLKLINCTVTGNTSGVVSGTPNAIYLNSGTAYLRTTIINEGGAGCGKQGSTLSLTSEGYNLDRGTSCGLNSVGDRQNVDPLLGPLSANGGSTPTHALLLGSPAIDAAPVYSAPATDQRGTTRPQFPCPFPPCFYFARSILADIGAYEFIPGPNVIPLYPWPTLAH